MKEVAFTLETGKEVPERLNGTVVRFTVPTTPDECLAVCGGNSEILVSVFNEGYILNHRQKIAKRAAAREGSSITTIDKMLAEHKPGIRTERDPNAVKAKTERAKAIADMTSMVDALPPEQRDAFRAKLAALKPVKKAKPAEGATETAAPVTETTAPAAAAKGQKAGK